MEKNLKVYFAENGLLVRDGDGGINAKVQLFPSNGAVRAVGELVWKSVTVAVKAALSDGTELTDAEICTKAEGVDVKVTLTPFGVVSDGTDDGDGTDTPTDGEETKDDTDTSTDGSDSTDDGGDPLADDEAV